MASTTSNPQESKLRKYTKSGIAGGVAGGLEILIMFPTEYVKTQVQLDERSVTPRFKGPVDCVKKTWGEFGFFGFYRGLSPLILGSIPKSAVRFGINDYCKDKWRSRYGGIGPYGSLLCGLTAGVAEAIVVVTPQETIKVKFIHDRTLPNPKYKGLLHGVREIVKEKGLRGTYQGLSATIVKQGTNQMIRFFVMDSLRDWYRGDNPEKHIGIPLTALFGGIAGAASVFGNTPVDVVKTRMQGLEAHKYKNTWDCVVKIWKYEGAKAFYKGTMPRLSRVCADAALQFTIFDEVKKLLNKLMP